jgi:hypothetical protein
MRLVMVMVLAALVALPLSAGAQTGQEGTDSEPNLHEPAPEEPALQLKLDAAGVEVTPSPSRTEDGYTLEELELRVQRAKIGLGVSAAVLAVGGALTAAGAVSFSNDIYGGTGALWGGVALAIGGVVGMITTGAMLTDRKRKLRRLQEAHYGTPRRAQWDLARSRLVF